MSTWLISALSIVGGALLTLITTLIVNRVSYRNEYYKIIIEKRIQAYKNVEHLLNNIKRTGLQTISQAILNNNLDLLKPLKEEIDLAQSESIWLSRKMKNALQKMELLLFSFEMECYKKVELGKGWDLQKTIYENTITIEQIHKRDMLSMHNVRSFLKDK